MKTTCIVALATAVTLLAARANAQPALDRVEQQMRQSPAVNAAPAAEPGYLGVIADDRQDKEHGVRVMEVISGGPAAQGGLKTGDVIVSINGNAVAQMDDLATIIERSPSGTKLEFAIERGGAARKEMITLGRRPPPAERPVPQFGRIPSELPGPSQPQDTASSTPAVAAPGAGPRLGLYTVPVTDEVRRQYNLPDTSGALVTRVTLGTPAEKAAVPLAAVITAVDGQPVGSPADLAELIRRADKAHEAEITYTKDGDVLKKRIVLAGSPSAAPSPAPAPTTEFGATGPAPTPAVNDLPVPQSTPGARTQVARRAVDAPPAMGTVPFAAGAPQDPRDARIQSLEQRIRELEERLKKLEATGGTSNK